MALKSVTNKRIFIKAPSLGYTSSLQLVSIDIVRLAFKRCQWHPMQPGKQIGKICLPYHISKKLLTKPLLSICDAGILCITCHRFTACFCGVIVGLTNLFAAILSGIGYIR